MTASVATGDFTRVRAAAADGVVAVLQHGLSLDQVLPATLEKWALPAGADRSMVQELVYGTLRWHVQLSAIADRLLHRPLGARDQDLRALLLVGLYQIRKLAIADSLAVGATVEGAAMIGKSWAKGMLNACLRRGIREAKAIDAWVAADAVRRTSHPEWLLAHLRDAWPERWESIAAANNMRPPLTLRVNTRQTTVARYMARLREQSPDLHASPIDAVASALLIEPPVPVERLPGFDTGEVSVQDAAAQLATFVLDAQEGERVLDACAAPGGKACHILEHSAALGELVAVDIDERRLARLHDNLRRLRLTATVLCVDAAEPATWWDGIPFDRILLDAPCSATGVIRRHPDIKVRREPNDLSRLLETQKRLLTALWPLLRRGGKLVYATCSILPEENDRQIAAFIRANHEAGVAAASAAAGHRTEFGLQTFPGEQSMDGFYYACVVKAH